MQNHSITIEDVLNDHSKDLNEIYGATFLPDNDNAEIETQPKDSHYYNETELTDLLKQKKISDSTHLKILSLNIANLLSKLSSLKIMLQNISNESNRPNIIALTETHLNGARNQGYSESELKTILPGYKFFHKDRKNRLKGGVGVFVENRFADKATIEPDGFFVETIFEGITLRIPDFSLKSGKKDLIILTIYRQPDGNLRSFLDILEKWLEKYDKTSNEIIVTGDLNLDLLKYESHPSTSEYLDSMISHQLLPAITKPTRIKHSSATLIDHIFSKCTDMVSGILLSELARSHGYTDHYPVFCILETKKEARNKRKMVTSRFFTTEGHKTRREGLRQENWDNVFSETDPNTAYSLFQGKYCNHYNQSITTKTFVSGQNKHPVEPWMTSDILQKMRKRDRLAKIKNRREDYQRLRNEIVKDCRTAERSHINQKIQKNINDTKEHWKILKKVLGQMNDKSDLPSAFKHNDTWITDMKESAELMNSYYSNVGLETNRGVGTSRHTHDYFLNKHMQRNTQNLLLSDFDENDVLEACRLLNPKKSCDAYGLSQMIVLRDIDILAPMIVHIANCSLNSGTCPDLTKIARVIPIFKNKGDISLFSNYRPISLLPVFSKILEKLMYSKIFHFLVRYQILFKSQYGYRKGHNSTQATLDFLQTIEGALQDNEYAIGVFCDLSKAFDTLDHEILLNKLDHYGIRGKWLSWLRSYLSNRKQYVDLNGVNSNPEKIPVGVPQGSILGPLLFLIYVNDLPASLDKLTAVMFADDTNLVTRGENLLDLVRTLNSDLAKLNDYFKANKLKLNIDKTKMVCFRKKGLEFQEEDLQVTLDGIQLQRENTATFLGITIDEHLSWETHCNSVANKMARNAGILNRVKKILPTSSLQTLYNSLIFTHFSYGIEVWGGCQSKHLKRIIGIQKKSIRTIYKSQWLDHTEPRMKHLNTLKVNDQHYLQCLSLIFDMLKGHSPDIYNLVQEQNMNVTLHTLRSATDKPGNIRLPSFNALQVKTSFLSSIPTLWNALPADIQNAATRKQFKAKLKRNILDHYHNKVSCHNPRCTDRRFHLRLNQS